MPNYEHFKKYDEWSKQKQVAKPEPEPDRQSFLARLFKSKQGQHKK